jgi:hypothetical protein
VKCWLEMIDWLERVKVGVGGFERVMEGCSEGQECSFEWYQRF